MIVSELMEQLSSLDPDRLVLISSDEEGNGFNEFHDVSYATVVKDGYQYEIVETELTPELEEAGYSEEDIYEGEDIVDAIILWP